MADPLIRVTVPSPPPYDVIARWSRKRAHEIIHSPEEDRNEFRDYLRSEQEEIGELLCWAYSAEPQEIAVIPTPFISIRKHQPPHTILAKMAQAQYFTAYAAKVRDAPIIGYQWFRDRRTTIRLWDPATHTACLQKLGRVYREDAKDYYAFLDLRLVVRQLDLAEQTWQRANLEKQLSVNAF